jgi:hypothetical protein
MLRLLGAELEMIEMHFKKMWNGEAMDISAEVCKPALQGE